MKHYLTDVTKKMKNIPTEYEFQRIAVTRELITSQKELDRYQRLETGVAGEDRFHDLLTTFGLPHWYLLRNTWFNDYSNFECDFILITCHCVYVFEVKNYFGKFVYENGQCSSRGVDIAYNPINQARNATVHLRKMTNKFSHDIPVKGVLVFIGEHNDVHIEDEIDYIDILQCNEVYQYIQDIILEEKGIRLNIDIQNLISIYEQFEIIKPYMPKPYSKDEIRNGKTGIPCARCKHFDVKKVGSYIHCACGFRESREEAVVRTACEYGVLTFGQDFTVIDIREFLDYQVSYRYLRKILSKHFERIAGAKVLTFRNYSRDYSYLNTKFEFDLPSMLVF